MTEEFALSEDFGLDGFKPADAQSQHHQEHIWPGDLTVLVEHHTQPHGSHSFLVAHDSSMTWGVPGEPQLVAIAIRRDLNQKTFTYEAAHLPTMSLAQNWLIERSCPPDEITQVRHDLMKPADETSLQIEKKIRESGERYTFLDSFTSDYDPAETWTLLRDGQADQAPIRVFLETAHFANQTYTVREGAFADEETARRWLDDRDGPLPQPPEHGGEAATLRARAALVRSAGASPVTPKADHDAPSAPSARAAERPSTGRSM